MPKTHIAYDTRSGRIISVHHGEPHADRALERVHHHSKISREHLGLISVASESMQRGKRYTVDLNRKVLVEAPADEGVGFNVHMTGPLP